MRGRRDAGRRAGVRLAAVKCVCQWQSVAVSGGAMASPGLLPTYARLAHAAPLPLLSRRSFRPREKYLIVLVLATFALVCFGAFFFLPEFRSSGNAVNDSVYRVYRRMQKAGPELLIPAPPLHNELAPPPDLVRHNDRHGPDPHLLGDRDRLRAKIDEEMAMRGGLERPQLMVPQNKPSPASADASPGMVGAEPPGEVGEGGAAPPLLGTGAGAPVTVPPAPSDRYPDVNRGEDRDSQARQRRDKVKQVRVIFFSFVYLARLALFFL